MKSVTVKKLLIREANVDNSARVITSQLTDYLENFYLRLNQNKKKPNSTQIDKITSTIIEIITRNNKISRLLNGSAYDYIRTKKRGLTGAVTFGLGFCVDGRIARIYFGPAVSTWEVPGGIISTEKRLSDGKLIPKSHDLCEGIKREINPDKDLFEIFFAHFDSTDSTHGCAAMAGILTALKQNQDISIKEILSQPEIKQLLSFDKAEDANSYLIEKTSLEAITNFYNTCRLQLNLQPLTTVGIVALYDTATMGVVFNQGDKLLSSTDLTNQFKDAIQRNFKDELAKFGSFSQSFTEPEKFLEFSDQVMNLIELLLNPHVVLSSGDLVYSNGTPNHFFKILNDTIEQFYPDLTKRQKQALRFFISRTVAFQYMTGLSEVVGHPDHPFSAHHEAYMAVSERGEFVGKFDTEQAFGSSAANIIVGIRQIKIEISVMDKNPSLKGKPYILFVCNPISSSDYRRHSKGLQRARANNASFVREILIEPELKDLIVSGKLILVPTLIDDESREILEIIDHSAYL